MLLNGCARRFQLVAHPNILPYMGQVVAKALAAFKHLQSTV